MSIAPATRSLPLATSLEASEARCRRLASVFDEHTNREGSVRAHQLFHDWLPDALEQPERM